MNRRNLLKGLGLAGLGSLFTLPKTVSAEENIKITQRSSTCFLTPQETEGPFYFDPDLVRQNIREDTSTHVVKTGLPLNMLVTVIDTNCAPIPNVLVDIWHCDKDGAYSGYAGQPGGISTVGQNFLRGIQVTDENGQCSFTTIYPGWYPGRVTHVHFKVRLNSTTYVTSQFAFPDSTNTAVYNTPLYSGRGQNSTTNATDFAFQNSNPQGQIMNTTPNGTTGGYDGTYTIGITGVTGYGEPNESPEKFSLRQNYPNPFNPLTTIEYYLPVSSHVLLTVYDIFGKEIVTLVNGKHPQGFHEIKFDASNLNSGFYLYKLVAGEFVDVKEMLFIK
ncbi:MAG: T9SS type A sorting domain-containing protein [Bacteroidetes bacterium]|nr:MAG: T9SS type A sorting domain-containing protein [Bacteroidota bacterium]